LIQDIRLIAVSVPVSLNEPTNEQWFYSYFKSLFYWFLTSFRYITDNAFLYIAIKPYSGMDHKPIRCESSNDISPIHPMGLAVPSIFEASEAEASGAYWCQYAWPAIDWWSMGNRMSLQEGENCDNQKLITLIEKLRLDLQQSQVSLTILHFLHHLCLAGCATSIWVSVISGVLLFSYPDQYQGYAGTLQVPCRYPDRY